MEGFLVSPIVDFSTWFPSRANIAEARGISLISRIHPDSMGATLQLTFERYPLIGLIQIFEVGGAQSFVSNEKTKESFWEDNFAMKDPVADFEVMLREILRVFDEHKQDLFTSNDA